MNAENKKQLAWWSPAFQRLLKEWVTNNRLDLLDDLNNGILMEKDVQWSWGFNPYVHPYGAQTIDRKEEITFWCNSSSNIKEWIPRKEWPEKTFSECVFASAQSIADSGKTIDFFWSGGLDSTVMLLAFNELGLHKQLHVIMGGEPESSVLFDKLIKGRMDYTLALDENLTQSNVYSIPKPNEHVWTAGLEADMMFGGQPLGSHGNTVPQSVDKWEAKRRFALSNRLLRFVSNYQGDKIDLNNQKTFYMQELMEKFAINHSISGKLVHYNLTSRGWGTFETWHRGAGEAVNASSQKHYLKCKMPFRDFIYDFTKNEDISYKMPKYVSEMRLRFIPNPKVKTRKKSPPTRLIAVTGKGEVITRDNFIDYDWADYIAPQSYHLYK